MRWDEISAETWWGMAAATEREIDAIIWAYWSPDLREADRSLPPPTEDEMDALEEISSCAERILSSKQGEIYIKDIHTYIWLAGEAGWPGPNIPWPGPDIEAMPRGIKGDLQRHLDRIIQRLNEIANDLDDAFPTDLDMALDVRADSWDGPGDLPELSERELEAMSAEVAENEARALGLDRLSDALIHEYHLYTGCPPHINSFSRYSRSWHEDRIKV